MDTNAYTYKQNISAEVKSSHGQFTPTGRSQAQIQELKRIYQNSHHYKN